MKKLFTLIAFIGLALGANAQRHANVVFKSVRLTGTGQYSHGGYVPFYAEIENTGPDALKAADTLGVYLVSYDPSKHGYNIASSVIFPGIALNMGDSTQIVDTTGTMLKMIDWSGWASDSTGGICFGLYAYNRTADSVIDTAVNTGAYVCGTVTYLDVHKITPLYSTVSIYPNPAQSQANFDVTLSQPANVTLRIFDMIGREVYTQNPGRLNTGKHTFDINTSAFSNGIYLYQIIVGDEIKTGKFNVAK